MPAPACGGAGTFDVKIRYLHKETRAAVILEGDNARVTFSEPQFAVTPGQSAVFYREGRVYGGGIIDEVVPECLNRGTK